MTDLLLDIYQKMKNSKTPDERAAWLNHLKEILNAHDFIYDPILDDYHATIKIKFKTIK